MKLILLLAELIFIASSPTDELEVSFLNVGYGDAIVIRQKNSIALIDTGYPEQKDHLFAWFQKNQINQLDWLLLTHPHPDHLGSAADVVREFQPTRVGDNGEIIKTDSNHLTREFIEDYDQVIRQHPGYIRLSKGKELKVGEATLKVLWPIQGQMSRDWNTNSAVILVTWEKFRILLAGDCNLPGENQLIKTGEDIRADLLKVGHHGAADSCSKEFIEKINPRWAVISVGKNPWGNPDPNTITRLKETGIRVFQTSQDGDILFRFFSQGDVRVYSDHYAPLIFFARQKFLP